MAVDRTVSRVDLTYLRRRPKREAPTPVPEPAATPELAAPERKQRAGTRGLTPPKPSAPTKPAPSAPSAPTGGVSLTRPVAGGVSLTRPSSVDESQPPAAATPAPPFGGGLSLGRPTTADAGSEPAPETPQRGSVPDAERVTDREILAKAHRTVTLTRRQSAVGSLEFDVIGGGELCALWELRDGTAGLIDPHSGVHVSPEFGRRPVVELTGDRLVIGLRHVRQLRRVVIYLRFKALEPSRIVASLYDGCTIESQHLPAVLSDVCVALAIYHVDGELILRRENVWVDRPEEVPTAYGFAASWLPPIRRS